jgi:hypothetical protein
MIVNTNVSCCYKLYYCPNPVLSIKGVISWLHYKRKVKVRNDNDTRIIAVSINQSYVNVTCNEDNRVPESFQTIFGFLCLWDVFPNAFGCEIFGVARSVIETENQKVRLWSVSCVDRTNCNWRNKRKHLHKMKKKFFFTWKSVNIVVFF